MLERLESLEQLMPFATAAELLAERTRPVLTIRPGAGAGEAARLMAENDIGFLPVVDEGRLVGVVSERDIVRGVSLVHPTFVRDVMTWDVHAVEPGAKVPECLEIMRRQHVRHLPVLAGGRIQGVLSMGDLTGSLIERHEQLLARLRQEPFVLVSPGTGGY